MKPFSSFQKGYLPFRFFGLYFGSGLCLLVWTLSYFGALNGSSNLLYDTYARLLPEKNRTTASVLLVEAEYDLRYEGDRIWLRLLETLEQKGAGQIVFTFFPPNVSADFYQTAKSTGNVIFGRRIIKTEEGGSHDYQEPLPDQAANINLRTGALPASAENFRIHRDLQSFSSVGNDLLPHLVLVTARERTGIQYDPPDPFRVDFIGQPKQMPRISLSQLLSNRIIPELIRDKTVLVGLKIPYHFRGFITPVSPENSTTSPLEYCGFAVHTLLNGTTLRSPSPWEIMVCLVVTICISIATLQFFGLFFHSTVNGILLLLTPLGSGLLLYTSGIWFPIVEVCLVSILFTLLLTARDILQKDRIALKIILDKSLKQQEKIMPKSFFRSQDYWPLVVNMIRQTLSLERTIFLEAVEGDHRVKEVVAMNCSLEDIRELRRDYHRTPYKTALEGNTAIRVDNFFTSLSESENAYLMPLNFSGQIQGFWAFTIDANKEKLMPDLLDLVKNFAVEIDEMLFRRKQWVSQEQRRNNPLQKILSLDKQNTTYHEVSRIIAFLVRRLSILESVFNSLNTATILYNPFGMVNQSNRKMDNLLQSLDLNTYEMSALDLAVQITGEGQERIRQLLSRVIINRETVQLPITATEGKQQSLMLRIRPMMTANSDEKDSPAQPLEMKGILFEINDVSSVIELSRIKEKLYSSGLTQLQGKLDALSKEIKPPGINTDQPQEKNDNALWQRCDDIMTFLQSINSYMGKTTLAKSADSFPVDLLEILNKSTSAMQRAAENRDIVFLITTSETLPLVLAAPDKLLELFDALLSLLIADAFENSTININVKSEQEKIICLLTNSGVGMPTETFQRFLDASNDIDRVEFKNIHHIQPELHLWKSTLTGSSDFGQGISFKLTLTPFR